MNYYSIAALTCIDQTYSNKVIDSLENGDAADDFIVILQYRKM